MGYLVSAIMCMLFCRGIGRDVVVFGVSIIGIRLVLAMLAEEVGAGALPGVPS